MHGLRLGLGFSRGSIAAAPSGVPVNVTPPTISGIPVPTMVLTGTQGTWTNSPTGFVYQWYDDGSPISGANSLTYTVASGISGNITFGVTPSNGAGSGAESISAAKTIYGTTLRARYDASDTATISHVGGSVSEIANKVSGGVAAGIATGTNQPLTGSVTQNGLNTIKFDGTDDVLIINDSLSSLSGGANTVLLVGVGLFSGTSNAPLFANFQSGLTFRYGFTRNGSSTNTLRFNHANSATPILTKAGGTAGAHVVGHRRNGTTMHGFLEGSASNTGMENRTDTSFHLGGSNTSGGTFSAMAFCEIFIFGESLTDAQVNELSNSLETKWAASWLDI